VDETTIGAFIETAAHSLARSVRRYWPVNGRNELGERNQTLHLATVLMRHDWHCWLEAHWDGGTDRRIDLLAWEERSRTLVTVEAKRLGTAEGVAALAADVARIASFCPIAHEEETYLLSPNQCFGVLLATTWVPKIARWWTSGPHDADPWAAGSGAWPDERSPAIRAANRGVWRAVKLGTEANDGDTDRHHLLYAVWRVR
jgi:hypothetical protein